MQTWYHCENTYPFVPPEVLEAAASVRGSLPNRYCDPKIAADLFHECLDEHPDWLPASQLSTAADYKAAVAQVGYDSATGPMIQPESITMPTEARPDTHFQVRSRFLVLTPDGSEVKVEIGRRLFAVSEGGEQELTIPAPAQERRTLPAGEHEDVVNLLIPKNAPLGVSYRVEFSVGAARGKPAATMVSATVKVL